MPRRNLTTALCSLLAIAVLGVVSCTAGMQPGQPTHSMGTSAGNYEQPNYVDIPGRGVTLEMEQRQSYLNAKRMSAVVRQRCIEGAYQANARCDQSVPVRITAVEGAKLVSSTRAPARAQLLAWIENLSVSYTTFDGIKPGDKARYALVAKTTMSAGSGDTTKRTELELLEFDRSWTLIAIHPRSNVFPCHEYGQPFSSEADFRPCTLDPSGARTPFLRKSTMLWKSEISFASFSAPTASFFADDPLWFSCSGGCCTSGNHGVEAY